jgi:hypothetical protein
VKNPVFKKQVEDLFEKLAWPFDTAAVQQQLASNPATAGTAADLGRGRFLTEELGHAADMLPAALKAIRAGGEAILAPAAHLGPPVLRAAGNVGKALVNSPTAAKAAIGTAVLAPILAGAFHSAQKGYEDDVMGMRRDPSRNITASLDEFLEKKASDTAKIAAMPRSYLTPTAMGVKAQESFASGIGGGVGKGVVDLAASGVGSILGKLRDYFLTDVRRKKLFESLLRTDQVLNDAIARHPQTQEVLVEAYGTLTRFAPSLAMDVNAVRSFLREVVLGGGGVNYATIKNLVETEKAITGGGKKG